jgi:hypothetical protein
LRAVRLAALRQHHVPQRRAGGGEPVEGVGQERHVGGDLLGEGRPLDVRAEHQVRDVLRGGEPPPGGLGSGQIDP